MIDLTGIAVRVGSGDYTPFDVKSLLSEVGRLTGELSAATAQIAESNRPCVWVYIGSGSWWTGCKRETDAKYGRCQFCGHPLGDGGDAGPNFDPWADDPWRGGGGRT